MLGRIALILYKIREVPYMLTYKIFLASSTLWNHHAGDHGLNEGLCDQWASTPGAERVGHVLAVS